MNTNELVAEIKDKVDLIEYVRRDTDLSRSGKSYRGHCPHPDHNDATPPLSSG